MSVILTACRNNRQKGIEKALKERAKKQKERREQQLKNEDSFENVNPMSDPSDIPGFRGYVQSRDGDGEAEGDAEAEEIEPATKIWTFLLDEDPFSIVFYKDTLDVYCNGEETPVMTNYPGDDTCDVTVDFCVGAHKARISVTDSNPLLTIDGTVFPE